MENSIDRVLEIVDSIEIITESYVLLREIRAFLAFEDDDYRPYFKVKIYKSNALPDNPYYYETSHFVHTPSQAAPYYPSRRNYSTEEQAINAAFASITSFISSAIRKGDTPDDSWLVVNDDF